MKWFLNIVIIIFERFPNRKSTARRKREIWEVERHKTLLHVAPKISRKTKRDEKCFIRWGYVCGEDSFGLKSLRRKRLIPLLWWGTTIEGGSAKHLNFWLGVSATSDLNFYLKCNYFSHPFITTIPFVNCSSKSYKSLCL
jgi:hypothetical protein